MLIRLAHHRPAQVRQLARHPAGHRPLFPKVPRILPVGAMMLAAQDFERLAMGREEIGAGRSGFVSTVESKKASTPENSLFDIARTL